MSNFETLLRRLNEEPVPAGLASIERPILERVSGHSFEREPLRFRVAAVTVALLMGVAGGMLPESGAKARSGLAPLGESAGLAPSSLLAGDR